MADDMTTPTTIDRRELLQRGALVGGAGALMWAAPSVTRFGSPAFGSTAGTPRGKDFSYIAVRYSCDDDDDKVYSIKWEFEEGDKCPAGGPSPCITDCETGDFSTPAGQNTDCDFDTGEESGDCESDKFTITFPNNDLKTIVVTINGEGDCLLEGTGVGKCGAPAVEENFQPCTYVTAPADGTKSLTFALCGV